MALTEASAAGLAAVLKSNIKLETLQLGGNTLGDRGASVVAQAAAASAVSYLSTTSSGFRHVCGKRDSVADVVAAKVSTSTPRPAVCQLIASTSCQAMPTQRAI